MALDPCSMSAYHLIVTGERTSLQSEAEMLTSSETTRTSYAMFLSRRWAEVAHFEIEP
jgi:hypothetical protein